MKYLLVLTCLVMACLRSSAQNFSIDWFTIDSGGDTSTGGNYSITGTIGQVDAGQMSASSFALTGGFWGILGVIQGEGAPWLHLVCTNGTATLYWEKPATGFVLDYSGALTGNPVPWTQLSPPYQTNTTTISISIPAPAGNRFFRLRKP